ncbi:MAG: hypothetical protein C5B50_27040 [Verrucomicrobia bacterium]|nr:MAG: hypothetical protein C5B50_27040 [Verrucomicrobiota bacterium]
MNDILKTKEFAGAVAEVSVIEELSSLPDGSLIFNDLKIEADRYVHFEGKPLMSAQIDTLVITTGGVFVIEVKNWSSEFAQSGDGFNPYEQVGRASYLTYDRLRTAGLKIRVRSIIATNGRLPPKEDQKVTVVSIPRLRNYIENSPPAQLNPSAIRSLLRL